MLSRSSSASSAARARPSLSHEGPLLLYYDPGVGHREFLDATPLRLGEASGDPVELLHRCGFALGRLLGRVVLLPHEKEREAEHHVGRRVDGAGGGIVRLAERQRHEALHHGQPRDREHHGKENDKNTQDSRGRDYYPLPLHLPPEPAYIAPDQQATDSVHRPVPWARARDKLLELPRDGACPDQRHRLRRAGVARRDRPGPAVAPTAARKDARGTIAASPPSRPSSSVYSVSYRE